MRNPRPLAMFASSAAKTAVNGAIFRRERRRRCYQIGWFEWLGRLFATPRRGDGMLPFHGQAATSWLRGPRAPRLPDLLFAFFLQLRSKIASATSAIKSVFGQEVNKLEQLGERMVKVRELFRDIESTEFIIVTIPTVMAISESSRLHSSLQKESVPVRRLIVNQVLPPSTSDCKFCAIKRKDQTRALDMIRTDPELKGLNIIQAPLVDMEIRGVPAHNFLGDILWK
ncbi:putative arsenical pump-driving ATPase [Zea mays]|uniref:Putative arsenical pump-driving ATPase n=1 Tax=Zea mays TaxID=4577 RepID=A0A3L6EHQ2_MAIZE|nr:putative arsenical pump-driving ATPase [Zea mays]